MRNAAIDQKRAVRTTKTTSVPTSIASYLRRLLTGRLKKSGRSARSKDQGSRLVKRYETKLWGGYSRQALNDINEIKNDESRSPRDRGEACYTLARWYAADGDYAAALQQMQDRRLINPKAAATKKQFAVEALFLCHLRRTEEARRLLEEALDARHFDSSVELLLANTWNPSVSASPPAEGETNTLRHINNIYRHFRLAEIEKRDPQAPLSLDNLKGKGVRPCSDTGSRITVIVPTYNAAGTIRTAMVGLAEQSWGNIEVIVVDDASEDDTAEIVEAFCEGDPRFKLIRRQSNAGSYSCRNLALEHATGDYVTVHDSDDWSHPQKLEMQLRQIADQGFNCSMWARADSNLFFTGANRASPNFLIKNFSSYLFPTEAVRAIGGWDARARVSADTEFVWRFGSWLEGKKEGYLNKKVMPACPLSFGRFAETSLTRSGNTHVSSMWHGVRREYLENADWWHKEKLLKEQAAYSDLRFPLPATISTDRKDGSADLDLLFIGDFNMSGGTYHSAMNMLRASLAAGKRCGLLHYRRYDLDVAEPLKHVVRDFAWENGVRILAPGERAKAATVVVTHPPLFDRLMDRFPQLDHEHLVVVVNQMAERDTAGTDIAYDPERVRAHLVEVFGHEGSWVPISNRVRALMDQDARYPQPHEDTWTPLIDVGQWLDFSERERWRGNLRSRPILGRHGRDHRLKWPATRTALLNAYCADEECDVRFLGGTRHAEALLGSLPPNWHSHPFGSYDVKEFLADLDFFLHFPHEDYIEEFGRAPMEAMAIGVPVILPPIFEATFGPAALYAEPREVWPTIAALWRSPTDYQARVAAGRAFVAENCDLSLFEVRIERIACPARSEGRVAQ